MKFQGEDFQGRALYIDVDGGKVKRGYRSRGNHDAHTKYNERVSKKIRKRNEEERVRKSIKNYKPKFRRYDEGDYDDHYEGQEEV